MDALTRLHEWQSKYRERCVDLSKQPGYGTHDWELRLTNVNQKPGDDWIETEEEVHHATVVGIDNDWDFPDRYEKAPNFIHNVVEGDLHTLIHKTIDRANALGL